MTSNLKGKFLTLRSVEGHIVLETLIIPPLENKPFFKNESSSMKKFINKHYIENPFFKKFAEEGFHAVVWIDEKNWHVDHSIALSLKLFKSEKTWISPYQCDLEVINEKSNKEGIFEKIEILENFFEDYLSATDSTGIQLQIDTLNEEYTIVQTLHPKNKSFFVRDDPQNPPRFKIGACEELTEIPSNIYPPEGYLYFDISIIDRLRNLYPNLKVQWNSKYIASLSLNKSEGLQFGINDYNVITVFYTDIKNLKIWHQQQWAGFSISKIGGPCEELFNQQMNLRIAKSTSFERLLEQNISILREVWFDKFGFNLFNNNFQATRLYSINRLFSVSNEKFYGITVDFSKSLIECLDNDAIKKYIFPSLTKEEKETSKDFKSLKMINLMLSKKSPDYTSEVLSNWKIIKSIRDKYSHVSNNKTIVELQGKLGIIETDHPFKKCEKLLETAVSDIITIIDVVKAC